MTLDIEEFRTIKLIIEVMQKEIKEQRKKAQLAIDGWRDEKYKQQQRDRLEKLEKAMEWLKMQ